MFGECHAHMLMDGVNYREAVARHRDAVCEEKVREFLKRIRGLEFLLSGMAVIMQESQRGHLRLPENTGSTIGHRFLLSIKKDIMAGSSDAVSAI